MGLRIWTGLALTGAVAAALLLGSGPGLAQANAGDTGISGRQIDNGRSAVAIAAVVVLGVGLALRRAGRPDALRRTRDGLLAALGIAGALGGWNFLQFHNPGYLHPSDAYHYFVGAKYFRELGYSRLYACSTIADHEAGLDSELEGARVRNLATNRIEDASVVLADPDDCKRHFTPERWQAFRRDVAWFRARHAPALWRRVHQDHGYNATPAWSIAGSLLTNLDGPTGKVVQRLSWIDPVLLVVAFAAVGWTFGWRSLCVATIFWGTFQTASYAWTGGSILRMDWLAALLVGLCLLDRRRFGLAGLCLAVSALLRIFPGVVFAGIALAAAWRLRTDGRWRLPREAARIAVGAGLAVAIVIPASIAVTGNAGVWSEFARNSRVHLDTPLRNHVGLQTVLSYDHATRTAVSRDRRAGDPYAVWKEGRRAAFERRRPVFVALVAAFAALLVWAVRGRGYAVAAIAGLGLIPVALELTGYYYSALAGYALLHRDDPRFGFALCGLSASSWLSVQLWHSYDESYTWTGLACVLFAYGLTVALGRRPEPLPGNPRRS